MFLSTDVPYNYDFTETRKTFMRTLLDVSGAAQSGWSGSRLDFRLLSATAEGNEMVEKNEEKEDGRRNWIFTPYTYGLWRRYTTSIQPPPMSVIMRSVCLYRLRLSGRGLFRGLQTVFTIRRTLFWVNCNVSINSINSSVMCRLNKMVANLMLNSGTTRVFTNNKIICFEHNNNLGNKSNLI